MNVYTYVDVLVNKLYKKIDIMKGTGYPIWNIVLGHVSHVALGEFGHIKQS